MTFLFNHDQTEAINCAAVKKFSIVLDDYYAQANGSTAATAWVIAELDNPPVNEIDESDGVKLKEFKIGDTSENLEAAQAWLIQLVAKLNGNGGSK